MICHAPSGVISFIIFIQVPAFDLVPSRKRLRFLCAKGPPPLDSIGPCCGCGGDEAPGNPSESSVAQCAHPPAWWGALERSKVRPRVLLGSCWVLGMSLSWPIFGYMTRKKTYRKIGELYNVCHRKMEETMEALSTLCDVETQSVHVRSDRDGF